MIGVEHVPEDNKRLLLEFRRYLEGRLEDEAVIDARMADASLYALDYTSACLCGASVTDMNAFDAHCFLADYLICHQPDCSAETIIRVLDSLSSFALFLEEHAAIDAEDIYEVLTLCQDPRPYIWRWQEYCRLVESRDTNGLQRWRESVLDGF